jgi:hypothetical protein
MRGGVFVIEIDITCLDGQKPAIGHRVTRVRDHVEERVLELPRISVASSNAKTNESDLDALRHRATDELGHLAYLQY